MKVTSTLTFLLAVASSMNFVSADHKEGHIKATVLGYDKEGVQQAGEAVKVAEQGVLEEYTARRLQEEGRRQLGDSCTLTLIGPPIEYLNEFPCGAPGTGSQFLADQGHTYCFSYIAIWAVDFVCAPGGSPPPHVYTWVTQELDADLQAVAETSVTAFKNLGAVSGRAFAVIGGVFAKGDPHFKGFSGEWFDYHGECDLVLMEIPNFQDDMTLTVHARTTIRYHYSYISSIAARLGSDVFEVSSFGDYALNGIEGASLDDAYFGGYPLEHSVPDDKNHLFKLLLTSERKVIFKTFKDLVSIEMDDIMSDKPGHGILGDMQTGKLLGRDGKTVFTDMNAFGQEWQVRDTEPMLFRVARAPQYPEEKCRLPKVSASDKRRLGETMAREKAEIACGRFTGVEFDNCVFDVMAVGDIDIAKAGAV